MGIMGGTHRPQQETAGAETAQAYYAKRPLLDASGIIASADLLRKYWSMTGKATGAFIDGFVEMATIVAQGRAAEHWACTECGKPKWHHKLGCSRVEQGA
jgi:hypothetical protein